MNKSGRKKGSKNREKPVKQSGKPRFRVVVMQDGEEATLIMRADSEADAKRKAMLMPIDNVVSITNVTAKEKVADKRYLPFGLTCNYVRSNLLAKVNGRG